MKLLLVAVLSYATLLAREPLDKRIGHTDPSQFKAIKNVHGGAGELHGARELWATRLKETVTLLETLRVGLLKLHAGTVVPDQLTADLEAAHALRERLTLLAEGQSEVEKL